MILEVILFLGGGAARGRSGHSTSKFFIYFLSKFAYCYANHYRLVAMGALEEVRK